MCSAGEYLAGARDSPFTTCEACPAGHAASRQALPRDTTGVAQVRSSDCEPLTCRGLYAGEIEFYGLKDLDEVNLEFPSATLLAKPLRNEGYDYYSDYNGWKFPQHYYVITLGVEGPPVFHGGMEDCRDVCAADPHCNTFAYKWNSPPACRIHTSTPFASNLTLPAGVATTSDVLTNADQPLNTDRDNSDENTHYLRYTGGHVQVFELIRPRSAPFEINGKCRDGYSGTPVFSPCVSQNRAYFVSGCTKDAAARSSDPAPGYFNILDHEVGRTGEPQVLPSWPAKTIGDSGTKLWMLRLSVSLSLCLSLPLPLCLSLSVSRCLFLSPYFCTSLL